MAAKECTAKHSDMWLPRKCDYWTETDRHCTNCHNASLVGWLYWGFTLLQRYFSHIETWKQEITNLWKFKWWGRESNPGPLAPQAKSLTTWPSLLHNASQRTQNMKRSHHLITREKYSFIDFNRIYSHSTFGISESCKTLSKHQVFHDFDTPWLAWPYIQWQPIK